MSQLMLLALCAQILTTSGQDQERIYCVEEGHEDRAAQIIAPHDSDTMVLEGWALSEMVLGPACAIHFAFTRQDSTVRFTYGQKSSAEDPVELILDEVDVPHEDLRPLEAAFAAVLESNRPREIFQELCHEKAYKASKPENEEEKETQGAGLTLALLLPLAFLALLLLRHGEPPQPRAARTRRDRILLLLLVGGGVLLRILVAVELRPNPFELENFPRSPGLSQLLDILSSFVHPPPPDTFHAPLLPTLLDGWLWLGDALGVGGQLPWLRLMNVALSAAMIWLLLRLGEALGDRRVGWLSAVVFALSPTMIGFSIPQGHYFLEMVATTWFLERLAAGVVQRRSVHRSLALAAAVALWSGFICAVVILPGLALHAALTWRRGARRHAFAVLLLVVALAAPILGTGLTNMLNMGAVTTTETLQPGQDDTIAAVWGHATMTPKLSGLQESLSFIRTMMNTVFGFVLAPLALLAMLFHLVRRPREGWLPLAALVAMGLLGMALPVRAINLVVMVPLILLGGLRALLSLSDLLPRRVPRWSADATLLMILLGGVLTIASTNTSDEAPLAVQAAGWLGQGSVQETISATMTEDTRELPLVRGTYHEGLSYHLCKDRSSVRAVVGCLDPPILDGPDDGILRYQFDGRIVWELSRNEVMSGGLGHKTEGGSIWRLGGPYLLVLDKDYHADLYLDSGLDPITSNGCRFVHGGRAATVWRCGDQQ